MKKENKFGDNFILYDFWQDEPDDYSVTYSTKDRVVWCRDLVIINMSKRINWFGSRVFDMDDGETNTKDRLSVNME